MRLLLALVLGCAACGAPDAEDAEVAGDALNNGQGTASHPEVGRLELKGSALGEEHLTHCVGTLVSPTVVLTSRACSFGDLIEAGGTFFIDRDSDGDGKVDATNAFAVKYQDALTHSATGNASRRGRFAFVKLEKAVPASVATPAVLRKAALSDDEKVVAVGFGDTSEDWGAKTTASFVLRYDGSDGPRVMQRADRGCPVFDESGKLAAVGIESNNDSWLFGHPDNFVGVSEYYAEIEGLIAKMSAE